MNRHDTGPIDLLLSDCESSLANVTQMRCRCELPIAACSKEVRGLEQYFFATGENRRDVCSPSNGGHTMSKWDRLSTGLVIAMILTASTGMSWATEQAQQRRAGRDVRQDTRQGARHNKQDCRAANQQSNSQCRQDKRHTKQGGRQAARDIKY